MKLNAYDVHELPQEAIDLLEDIRTLLNFGKYQQQVITSVPTWIGRKGESVTVFGATTAAVYMCTTDGRATWKAQYTFPL